MSHDAEKIKGLLAFKKKLEKRIEDLESELKELQATLETVNSILLEKGFKRAEVVAPPQGEVPAQAPKEPEKIIALKTAGGELLANLFVGENSLRVMPAEDKNFNINTPPFNQFLLEKVFLKMQEKDAELARTGQLPPEKIFSFDIVREGDVIRELIVKNLDAERLKELKSSVRWTLEKMYEKMKS